MALRDLASTTQVSHSSVEQAAEGVTLEIACCCNLALACIKGGEMVEAETVCSRALQRSPSCVKALFRRGQARLALGRLQEADIDFRKVADLEPTNIDVGRMLQCVEREKNCSTTFSHGSAKGRGEGNYHKEGKPSSRVRLSSTDIDDSSTKTNNVRQKRLSRMELPYWSDYPTETDIFDKSKPTGVKEIAAMKGTIPSAIAQGIDHSLEHVEVDPEQLDFPAATTASTSGFMAPGWLNSVERQKADQKRRNKYNQDNIPSGDTICPLNRLIPTSDSIAKESTRNDSTVTSPLVSKLKEHGTTRSRHTQSRGACTVTQSEWLRLQTEENKKLDILKERSALLSRTKGCNKGTRQCGRSQEKAYSESKTSRGTGAAGQSTQASEWEMLEKKERELRSAFRAKLAIGEKKRENAISHLRTKGPS